MIVSIKKLVVVGLFLALSCSKEEIKNIEILLPIHSNVKKSLPSKFKTTIQYKDKAGRIIDFYADGQYYKSPQYKKDVNPFEFREYFKWELKDVSVNSLNVNRIVIDSSRVSINGFTFYVYSSKYSDSSFFFSHLILPKDSVYQSNSQIFYKNYTVGGKSYSNCYELYDGRRTKRMIYNYTEGILYFEAAGGESFSIYNP